MANSVTVALPEANGNIYSGLNNSFYATDGPGDPPMKIKNGHIKSIDEVFPDLKEPQENDLKNLHEITNDSHPIS